MGQYTSIQCEVTKEQRRAICFEVEKYYKITRREFKEPVMSNVILEQLKMNGEITKMKYILRPTTARIVDPMQFSELIRSIRCTGVHLMMEPHDVLALQYGMFGEVNPPPTLLTNTWTEAMWKSVGYL
jgi:hypothetical protein